MKYFDIVNDSDIHGWYLRATTDIQKGTVLVKHNLISSLSDDEISSLPREIIDRPNLYKSNLYLFYTNHSCNPNCWFNSKGDLICRRNIHNGEEITYDYSTHEIGYEWTFPWKCNCNSCNCRKIITTNDILKSNLYTVYKGHLPSWVQDYVTTKQS